MGLLCLENLGVFIYNLFWVYLYIYILIFYRLWVFFFLREFFIMLIDFLLLSCLKFKLKKRDKNVFNVKKLKFVDFIVLFFFIYFWNMFFFFWCLEFVWLDGVGLIFYWGVCCWLGIDFFINVKVFYYIYYLRVCIRELLLWNYVFIVNIDLFEVVRNVCGFVLWSNCRKC